MGIWPLSSLRRVQSDRESRFQKKASRPLAELQARFKLLDSGCRYLHVLFGFAAAEGRDHVAGLPARNDATFPAEFAGHRRAHLAAAILERIRHLDSFGVGDTD